MQVADIILLITQGVDAIRLASETYSEIKDTLNEHDQKKIEDALANAQAETKRLRSLTNAALSKASTEE